VRRILGKAAELPRRVFRNLSVATRLSLVVLVVALVSLVITSGVGLSRGTDIADELLRDRTTALGAARAEQVQRHVASIQRIAATQAISPSTAEAIDAFATAYRELQDQGPSNADEEAVDSYYADTVAPELSAVRDRPVGAASLVPEAAAAVYLQARYVLPTDGGGSLLDDAGDGSSWSELHRRLHQSLSDVAVQAGVDDLYLIEPTNNTVVYSSAKGIDFATSLLTGPQSGTALAVLVNSVGARPAPGVAAIIDFTSYSGAGGEPSAFIASPVIVDGAVAGFVALRFGPDRISAITTDGGRWLGEGATGETYLVARDDLLRSDARGFVEDRSSFFQAVRDAGAASEEQIRLMKRFDTTVLQLAISDKDTNAALDNEPELVETTNYLGADVLQARRPLDIDGLEWAMITEVQRAEISQPIVDFARNLLIAIALFLVGITVLAVRWSDRLLGPVRMISANLRAVRAGAGSDELLTSNTLPEGSASEFLELATDIDTMLATLSARDADARAQATERHDLLRRLLPPQVAQRAEAGERDVIDQVANATIVVVVVRGLGSILESGSSDEARALLDRFVDEADALAKQRGLERLRLTGDAYLAGCGTVRPYIDHAARAVEFALGIGELVGDLADEGGHGISIGAGVDSGPVTVGLTGGSGLVYDAWGSTVQRAADLARRAQPNTVVVSTATRSQLPSTFELDEGSEAGHDTVVITGRRVEPETVG
jgi:class 3 adenylate cyclase